MIFIWLWYINQTSYHHHHWYIHVYVAKIGSVVLKAFNSQPKYQSQSNIHIKCIHIYINIQILLLYYIIKLISTNFHMSISFSMNPNSIHQCKCIIKHFSSCSSPSSSSFILIPIYIDRRDKRKFDHHILISFLVSSLIFENMMAIRLFAQFWCYGMMAAAANEEAEEWIESSNAGWTVRLEANLIGYRRSSISSNMYWITPSSFQADNDVDDEDDDIAIRASCCIASTGIWVLQC